MIFHQRAIRVFPYALALSLFLTEVSVLGQGTLDSSAPDAKTTPSISSSGEARPEYSSSNVPSPTIACYFDSLQGSSSIDLVRRALASNGELAAARLDIERARARVRQAGLRPNPTV